MDIQERLLYQDEQLRITVAMAPGVPTVTLFGQIDASNSPALASALAECRTGPHIVVDIGRLTFVDVSGLRVLALPALPPSQRWIRLHNVTPYQQRLLHIMGWSCRPTAP
ncbi:anti-sigma factor antagonist [Nonomuraea terrae]|uniref:Anti-sigma factor antagonist n=1 Tax=Nonomuraea terrae TaxID=2530383 RepID=A0A4R4YZJ9_9ACTN|nr:STAS domain-containing protein [Nonomuraea terrae]TDD49162.1 anti-sigma factor antagonist [Nonomuraea terrae]